MLAKKNYERSICSLLLSVVTALASLAGTGCAHVNDTAARALRVSFADLDGPGRATLARRLGREPTVIYFAEGDSIPVALTIDSPVFSLGGAEDIVLTAQRDVYLLLHDGPPLLSANGRDFETASQNYAMFGFAVKQGEPTRLQFKVGIRPDWAAEP